MRFSIRSIEVKNFRAVDKAIINFDNYAPGLYYILGKNKLQPRLGSNGAGKSTLFYESIAWALLGKTSRSSRPSSDVERRHSQGGTSVKIEFLLGNEVHTVERCRHPNNLLLDGRKVEQIEIDKVLPFNESVLRKTILIDQFNSMFLDLRPEEKSRIFSETLGLDKWLKAAESAAEKIHAGEKSISQHEKSIASMNGTLDEMKISYNRAIQNEEDFIHRKLERLAALEEKISNLEKDIKDLETEWTEVSHYEADTLLIQKKQQLGVQSDLQRDVASRQSELKRTRMDLERLQRTRTAYETVARCPECGQPIGAAEAAQKAAEATVRIDQLTGQIGEIEAGLSVSGFKLDKVRVEIEKIEDKINSVNKQIATSEGMRRALKNEELRLKGLREEHAGLLKQDNPYTEECNRLLDRYKITKKKRNELQLLIDQELAKLEIYKFWQKGFKEIRLGQIDSTLAELEISANQHAQSLGLDDWRIQFATERENKSGTVSHSFSTFLYPPDAEKPVSWDSYSGGESQRWQFACTFGLSEILLMRAGIEPDIEIYDEPTRHLSPEGIDDLLSCLHERAVGLGRRIFFIDHCSLDHGAFDGIVTVIKTKSNGEICVRIQ